MTNDVHAVLNVPRTLRFQSERISQHRLGVLPLPRYGKTVATVLSISLLLAITPLYFPLHQVQTQFMLSLQRL
jgi:hypothetical protein